MSAVLLLQNKVLFAVTAVTLLLAPVFGARAGSDAGRDTRESGQGTDGQLGSKKLKRRRRRGSRTRGLQAR